METNANDRWADDAVDHPPPATGAGTADAADTGTAEAAEVSPGGGPATPVFPEADYTGAGVPSFDYVRDRIEKRFTTAAGARELAEDAPHAAELDQQAAERERAGREKLEEIRRSMRDE